ncbi:MAG: hypothetical protein COC24_002710 [Alphaproteobacteria bacterium]|nr:hypothetical protein [Alphaproteobacteria bacterium]
MQAQGKNNFWIKIAVTCVVLALVFNLFSVGLGLMFSMLVGGFVDLILFVVLDVVVATILMAVDLLVFVIVDVFVAGLLIVIDVFVFLLLGALSVAGYAAMLAVVVIPLALIYKYSQKQKISADADYK